MRFAVSGKVFEVLENACFGVVVARGIDNKKPNAEISHLLDLSIHFIEDKFRDAKVKEAEEIVFYRKAFETLGINPNKFMSSIEAMTLRISKGKGFPAINPVVDLGNAISLKHLVPLGAHDLDRAQGDIQVRFSRGEDKFIPFGQVDEESLEPGELIYSVGDKVKTRRWIWRQSEQGKVTAESKNIFFPIDGFRELNANSVMMARDELAECLQKFFSCRVSVGLVDKDHMEMEI